LALLKQLVGVLTVSADGATPIAFRVEDGNTNDDGNTNIRTSVPPPDAR